MLRFYTFKPSLTILNNLADSEMKDSSKIMQSLCDIAHYSKIVAITFITQSQFNRLFDERNSLCYSEYLYICICWLWCD